MEKQTLTSILENQHFNQFAAILSVAMSPKWRMAHPSVPSVQETLEYRLARMNRGMLKDANAIKRDFKDAWTKMFAQILDADPKLRYRPEDDRWFTEVINGDESTARLTFSMLFAVATTRRTFLDAEQVAEITGEAKVTVRQKAERGEYIGAFKAGGKAWIIPELSLRAYGAKIPGTSIRLEVEEAESEE